MVQQLLIWREDKAATDPLTKLAASSKLPQVRVQALWTLEGLSTLADETLLRSLSDGDSNVRRHAVILSESRLAKSPAIAAGVLKLARDADPQVRMQVAYSLGAWNDPLATQALAKLISSPAEPYQAAATLSSLNKQNVGPILSHVLAAGDAAPPAALVEQLLALAAALGNDAAVREAMDLALAPQPQGVQLWQLAALGGLFDVLEKQKNELTDLVRGSAKEQLLATFTQVRQIAAGE